MNHLILTAFAEYYFSQYNKKMQIDEYTEAEYTEHMAAGASM